MDVSTLLQDLHFRSSTTDGSNEPNNNKLEQNVECRVSDKMKRTEQWVTNVQAHRTRAKSIDSYFKSPSVCDQLKKSFISTTAEKFGETRNLIALKNEVKITRDDTEAEVENLRKELKDTTLQGSISGLVPTHNPISLDSHSTCRTMPQHKRSRTISLVFPKSPVEQETRSTLHSSSCRVITPDSPRKRRTVAIMLAETGCFSSEQSITLDENCNKVDTDSHSKGFSSGLSTIRGGKSLPGYNENYKLWGQFRLENCIPTKDELLKTSIPKLKPNKIIGSYSSVLEYLETHFYLLREDFLQPLRDGIAEYRKKVKFNRSPQEVKNMKLYFDSSISGIKFQQNQLCVNVSLDARYRDRIGEKDFMFGSLVILTHNNFSDLMIGTVVSCEMVKLGREKTGRGIDVSIHLHNESHFNPGLKMRKFLLVESKAFFQSYYHVMKVFQNMKEEDFPLKEYIIRSRDSIEVSKPSYLTGNTVYKLDDSVEVKVLEDSTWPRAHALRVNESQLEALKTALREKLVVIQGPPGTGKTFLGCKVAKTLLKNVSIWNKNKNRPMLVVCQTNHALDQFMEKLIPTTENIIRVGSQSKSELLAKYNLRELRAKARQGRLGKECKLKIDKIFASLPNLKSLEERVTQYSLEVSRMMDFGIVNLKTFLEAGVIRGSERECFVSSKNFLEWLEEARDFQMTHNPQGKRVLIADHLPGNLVSSSCAFHNGDLSEVTNPLDTFMNDCVNNNLSEWQSNIQVHYIITIKELLSDLKKRQDLEKSWEEEGWNDWSSEATAQQIEDRITYLQLRFAQCCENKETDLNVLNYKVDCLWDLSPYLRWELYRFWVEELRIKLTKTLSYLEKEFQLASNTYDEKFLLQNLEIMRQADVIGMTTSAAARFYCILRELRTPIVIVEEAAEVHETHVVAALSQHCQHLILLGDHKQLRPSTASYTLCKQYQTDVSLFERLLLNETAVAHVLLTQHRMQPQVSSLIRPHIYPELYDHHDTLHRPNIRGMKQNVFFLSHCWSETRNHITGSYSNKKEADMAVAIACYLLKQNYDPSEICILATYRAQVSELEIRKNQHPELADVRMTSVDNFQGEESRIIILSLVRNNRHRQIGFLATENRTCVALSRARDGLYILGNLNLLCERSALWSSVRAILECACAVGEALPLHCDRHPLRPMVAAEPGDFNQYQKGGCDMPCTFTLQCQHVCSLHCHSVDSEHKEYECQRPCERRCSNGHRCLKKCHENCGTCEVKVLTQLPCGHIEPLDCSVKPNEFKCQVKVVKTFKLCHHTRNVPCWVPTSTHGYCDVPCNKYLQCGHICPLKCHVGSDTDHAKVLCQKDMMIHHECSHSFFGKCFQRNEPCRVKVILKLPSCNHNMSVECCTAHEDHICTLPCRVALPCGHKCKNLCNEPCTSYCSELIPHSLPLNECGHHPLVPCWKTNLPISELYESGGMVHQECSGPCLSVLMCGHICKGTCKQCKNHQIHIACSGICGRKLVCGHKCKAPCSLSCPPCGAACGTKCAHRKCVRRCGELCTPCLESCVRKCAHQACSRLCSEPCDVAPCKKNCAQTLTCGHLCQGYCGEPCPDICQVCSGINGLDQQCKLVKLVDCGCVISDELERKLWTQASFILPPEVHAPECPRCHSVVQSTLRYRELVQNYKHLEYEIQQHMVHKIRSLVAQTSDLLKDVRQASSFNDVLGLSEYKIVQSRLEKLLEHAAKSRIHSLHIEMICFISSLFMECVKFVSFKNHEHNLPVMKKPSSKHVEKFRQILKELEQHSHQFLNRQQMRDLQHFAEHLLSEGKTQFKTEPTEDNLERMWRGVWFECSLGHPFPWTPFNRSAECIKSLNQCCQDGWHSLNMHTQELQLKKKGDMC